jgi:hypothetical protein
VTFFVRLAAVLLVVAGVVALGVAWEHSSEAGWITPTGPPGGPGKIVAHSLPAQPPPGSAAVQGGPVFHARPENGGVGGIGLDFSDTSNLARTAEIEAAVVAGVVVLDVLRRRQRRARRASR